MVVNLADIEQRNNSTRWIHCLSSVGISKNFAKVQKIFNKKGASQNVTPQN